MLREAQAKGVLDHGITNYVNQVWKRRNPVSDALIGQVQRGVLAPNPSFANKRIFESYFSGEQQGFVPRDKDVGTLVSIYEQSFQQAVAARGFIHELVNGNVATEKNAVLQDKYSKLIDGNGNLIFPNGRPIVTPGGKGHTITDPATADTTYLITPRAKSEHMGDYLPVNHPAMNKWTWVDEDANGNPILVKGDLYVHPDHAVHLQNVLGESGLRKYALGRAALRTGGFLKGTFLVGPFHSVQEGVHAIFHGVNPFNPGEIDFNNATHAKLVDSGLMVADFHAMQDFAEGAAQGGLWQHVPGVGPLLQRYNEYLFQDYIPRLKMAMATEALQRNFKRYGGQLTSNQIHELTANQGNAAFGELNYRMLGRSKTFQDVMRLSMLAPDFLEARIRFNAQALAPFGREQSMALFMRGALSMWLAARITNKLLDDDYHFDQPFSIVKGDHMYTMRSLPGDDWHLYNDPRSFVYHRLNPFTTKPAIEAITGKDDFGRPKSGSEQVWDYVKAMAPLPMQGYMNRYGDTSIGSTLAESVGIRRDIYRTPAAGLAHKFAMGNLPMNYQSRGLLQQAENMRQGKFDSEHFRKLYQEGKVTGEAFDKISEYAQKSKIEIDFEKLKLPEAAQVYTVASPAEKLLLQESFMNKMDELDKMPPVEQQKAMEFIRKIMTEHK